MIMLISHQNMLELCAFSGLSCLPREFSFTLNMHQ